MQTIAGIVLLYLLFEAFEIWWQKAPTLLQMLLRIHHRYAQSIFYFLLLHPTYYFAIWLIVQTEVSIPSVLVLFIKTVDIATKIVLMQQVFDKKEVSQQLHEMLTAPLQGWMPYVGFALYTPLIIWALM